MDVGELYTTLFISPLITLKLHHMEKDLFDDWEKLPLNVQKIINSQTAETYKECDKLLKKLKPLGYTFDYYLDAIPYNLRKI
jgi:hypothetical protein